jgi:hypothetical protein
MNNCIDTLDDPIIASIKFVVFDDYSFDFVGVGWEESFKVVSFRWAADDGADRIPLTLIGNCKHTLSRSVLITHRPMNPVPPVTRASFPDVMLLMMKIQLQSAGGLLSIIYSAGISNINLDEHRHVCPRRNMLNCVYVVRGKLYHEVLSRSVCEAFFDDLI